VALRILHVTPYYDGAWAYGGIPRVATALTRTLAHQGHHVVACTTDAATESARLGDGRRNRRSAAPNDGADNAVDVRVFPNVSNTVAYRWQLFLPVGMSAYLRQHAGTFDVAHLHACRNAPGALAAWHLARAGVPFVLAPNGTAPVIERRRAAKRVFDVAFGRRMLREAASVLAVSEAERRQLLALGVAPDRVEVIPNPVDLEEFTVPPRRGRFRERFGLGAAPLVVFLGRLTPRKRVDVLVRAFQRLRDPAARLVIAGNDGGAEGRARALATSLGIAGRTVFTGLLPGQERLEALADADVVVYPSEHEIFGLVAVEALLAGSPVVVSDDSGCGEVVRATGGGEVVPPGDPAGLANTIQRVLDAPRVWRAAAAGAAVRVRAAFGADTIAARLSRLYESMVVAR
jgi:glycosyltransferase involved in cell wall biosynthesis